MKKFFNKLYQFYDYFLNLSFCQKIFYIQMYLYSFVAFITLASIILNMIVYHPVSRSTYIINQFCILVWIINSTILEFRCKSLRERLEK